ncbi:ABC transporter substrate-binding protein [Lentzea sp. PSKA42]|uniref:ABC transporter substrate-binding protein n=1 Tax=Lentzea indica TaxID=2604800 RepID=A0ABX1FUS1_9PSEU|nr:ABC transporter substrate-binding protein [Lentzea indica]NKE62366.1 ABC transporter substrate-binding protein [Lentzea indica]
MALSRVTSQGWFLGSDQTRGLRFGGAIELMRLLDRLAVRPRWPFRDVPLPIVHLRRPPGVESPLEALANRPATARGRRVAFAHVQGTADSERRLLDDVVGQLAGEVRGAAKLRFPHYALVGWLLDLTLPANVEADEEEREIAREFRQHLRRRVRMTTDGAQDLAQDFPWWIRLVIGLMPRIGLALMALLWRPATWVGEQAFGGRSRHGLYRLARAFVKERLAERHEDEVGDLLVRALLEDLRRSHRRWTLWGTGRRRTGYPWLLIDDVSGSTSGRWLVDAIGRARSSVRSGQSWRANPLSRPDPLLVISAGESGDVPPTHASDALAGYHDWLRHLSRSENWVLALDTDASEPARGVVGGLSELPPLHLRRAVAAPLVLLLIAASLVAVPFYNHARCDEWWSVSWRSPLERVGSECIGVSADPLRHFVPDSVPEDIRPALEDVYGRIVDENRKAALKPDAITIVFLSVLTPGTSNSFHALVEELRGVWVAQKTSDVPIKMLLANGGEGPGGRGLASADIAADKIIELAARDRSVVAVTGLSISTDTAKSVVKRLGSNALPVIGTLTSADDMASINEYYYQVGPNNMREARVAAYYAQSRLNVTDVAIFYSGDPADRYSQNLAEDARASFGERNIAVSQYRSYRVASDDEGLAPASLGQGACPAEAKPGYAVFYAGRSQYLAEFLRGMNSRCLGSTPPVIAGDSSTRFILEGTMAQFPNVRLDYLSFASPAAWADCAKVPFYKNYLDVFRKTCKTLVDGRSAAAYDSVQVLAEGVRQVRRTDPGARVREGLLAGIGSIRPDNAIQGATGTIGFSTSTRLPSNKAVLVLQGKPDNTSAPRLLCGELPFPADLAAGLEQDGGCPRDPQ